MAQDLFGGGVPALSFKDQPMGTRFVGTVTRVEPEMVQTRNFDTQEPDFWPSRDGQPGNPKMAVVFEVDVDGVGERSVWAVKPSAMFTAIREAQKASGVILSEGCRFMVEHYASQPPKSGRGFDQKLYRVALQAPPPKAPSDPFADAAPAAAPVAVAPPAAAPVSPPLPPAPVQTAPAPDPWGSAPAAPVPAAPPAPAPHPSGFGF